MTPVGLTEDEEHFADADEREIRRIHWCAVMDEVADALTA